MIRNLFFTAIVLSVYSLQLCSVYSMETGNPQSSGINDSLNSRAMLPQQQQQQGIASGSSVNPSLTRSGKAKSPKRAIASAYHPYKPMVVHAETNEQGDISVDISGKCTYKGLFLKRTKPSSRQLTFWRKCGSIDVHIKCHTNKVLYNSEDTIYNYIEERKKKDPEAKKRLDEFLLERIDKAQTKDGQVGCFLFKLPSSHTHSRSYFRKGLTLREAGHFSNYIAQLISGVAYLNSIGVIYDNITWTRIIIFLSKENASPLVKLIDFEFALFDPTNIDTHASAYSALLAKQKALVLFTMQSQMKDISSMIRKYTVGDKSLLKHAKNPHIDPVQLSLFNKQNDSLVRLRITLGIPNFDYPTLYHIFEKNPDYKIISKVLTLD